MSEALACITGSLNQLSNKPSIWRRVLNKPPGYFPIAYKLALVFTLMVSCGMIILGVVIARDQTRVLEQQIAESSTTLLTQMAEFTRDPLLANDKLSLGIIVTNLTLQENIVGAAIYTEDMQPLIQEGAIPAIPGILKDPDSDGILEWDYFEFGQPDMAVVSFSKPVIVEDVIAGYVLITFDRSLSESAKRRTINTVASATVLLVIVGIITSLVLGKRLTRPIYQLMNASRAITKGDYQFRFKDRRRDELGELMQSMNEMTAGLLRKEQVEQTFSRYVSPKVAREVLKNLSRIQLGGRHVHASVLFADIVGFTSMSEKMEPEQVNALLNEYFGYIAQVAHINAGYIDKYIGDCVMLVFGVPEEDKHHCVHAVTCAIMIQRMVAHLNERRITQGRMPVQFRIGVNSGMMLAGNMGSADRMEYTVVGDAVNLASRLSSAAGPGQILISEEVYGAVLSAGDIICDQKNNISLKGKRELQTTYLITDLSEQYDELINQELSNVPGLLGSI